MFDDFELDEYDKGMHRRNNTKQKSVKLLESLSVDRYENEFNRDWKLYLTEMFKYDDEPTPYVKPEPIVIKEIHPFEDWI